MMKRLILSILGMGLLLHSDGQVNLDSGLVAQYHFSSNALDSSGSGFHGTVVGATLTDDRFLHPLSSYRYDGDDHIDLSTDFDYPEVSVNLWFKSAFAPNSTQSIIASDHPGKSYGLFSIHAILDEGVPKVSFAHGTSSFRAGPLRRNRWYQLTMTLGDSVGLYVNSKRVSTMDRSFITSVDGHPTALLGTTRVFDRYFFGVIDDLRIYDRVLNEDEIGALNDNFTCFTPESQYLVSVDPNTASMAWSSVHNALNYRLQGREVGGMLRSGTVVDSIKHVSGLIPNRNYQWRVKTSCPLDSSRFTAINTFTTPLVREGHPGFRLYPNPARDQVNVVGKGLVELVDLLGHVMTAKNVNGPTVLDISDLHAGAYIVNYKGKSIQSQEILLVH